MGKFVGVYSIEENSAGLKLVVDASDIAEAIASIARKIPEGCFLQAVVGEDAHAWRRGAGFVDAGEFVRENGGQRLTMALTWTNVDPRLVNALADKIAALIISEMRRWPKNE